MSSGGLPEYSFGELGEVDEDLADGAAVGDML
jgi:hypothetical protein